jgi:hypothetical protein
MAVRFGAFKVLTPFAQCGMYHYIRLQIWMAKHRLLRVWHVLSRHHVLPGGRSLGRSYDAFLGITRRRSS